jgi:hypothetical protein
LLRWQGQTGYRCPGNALSPLVIQFQQILGEKITPKLQEKPVQHSADASRHRIFLGIRAAALGRLPGNFFRQHFIESVANTLSVRHIAGAKGFPTVSQFAADETMRLVRQLEPFHRL